MYRKARRRSAALYAGGAAAILACLAVAAFLIWSMAMKNSYRAMCLEINDAILSAPAERCSIGRGGEEYPADAGVLDHYDRFLLEDRVMPFSRRAVPADDRTLTLTIGENQLLLTGVDNGSAVNVMWVTPSDARCYNVRTGSSSFAQLSAYYSNLARREADGW